MKTYFHPAALVALLLLSCCIAAVHAQEAAPPDEAKLRAAITRGLGFLAREGDAWMEDKNCIGCHHMPELLWNHREAKRRGFAVDQKKFDEWFEWSESKLKKIDAGLEGVAFMVMAMPEMPRAEAEKMILAGQQADGSWKPASQYATMRLWSEAEAKANSTRIFLLALGTPDPANKAATEARAKAAAWTAKTDTPTSVETWLYRARFAQRFGKPEEAAACEKEILKLQRTDGGWSWWNAGTQSDAMATGETLHFLSTSKDPQLIAAANRARNWLLSTQREDGGWTLSSKWFSKVDRSLRKGENTTKNADSIYTYWGSSWATLGLLQAIPVAEPPMSQSVAVP